ncbi:MAG: hypothetical protein MUC87_08070 [Bacteroidia bacterium]|jgi:hypothetical protein|nr:hypothetical protein [Bacteroidia bacterium]
MFARTLLLSVAAATTLLLTSSFKDKCESDGIYQKALTKIRDFNLIKDYRVYLKRQKKADEPAPALYFPITLNRGEKYRFYGLETPEYEGKIVITIYNNMKREFQVATTYNKTTKTKYEAIEFKSSTTGTFCIGFTFLDGKEGCGVGIASFRKE